MLDELCADIRNYFVQSENDKHAGTYTINGGTFSPPLDFLKAGQYFRVVGSTLNDGVYRFDGCGVFLDETFNGSIWAMSVPPAFIALADRIKSTKTAMQRNRLHLCRRASADIRIAKDKMQQERRITVGKRCLPTSCGNGGG